MTTFADLKKSLWQLGATFLAAVLAATTGDNHIDTVEWINLGILLASTVGVHVVPNVSNIGFIAKYAKGTIAVVLAVLTLLTSVISGGIDGGEVIQLILAGLGAVGVVGWSGPMYSVSGNAAATRPAGTL